MPMWRGKQTRLFLVLGLVSLGLLIGGCGGGSSSAPSSSAASATSGSEASAQFLNSKSDRKYAEFGTEASTQELEAANVVVVENLKARESADFAAQCETLSLKFITAVPGVKNRDDCVAALTKAAEPLSKTKGARKDTLDGSIATMRVKGSQAYAFYHGTDGKDWAVPLEEEDGEWKVTAVAMIGL